MARPKKKVVKKGSVLSAEDKEKLCESCLKVGKKVIMTRRDDTSLECPKCNAWKPKPIPVEDKEAKRKRLEAELKALDTE